MATEPPQPLPSPRPPVVDGSDGRTPAYGVATPPYVQRKVDEVLSKLRTLGVAVAAVAATVVAAIVFVDNRVQAQTDAGVRVHENRIGTLEQQRKEDRSENATRFERLEAGQARTDAKLDAVLDRLRVPNPAPTPKDGGQ